MNEKIIKAYLVRENLSVVDAMARIDSNKNKTLFVVDDEQKLLGTATDGDIRRWIMKSGGISGTIADFMNRSPKCISRNEVDSAFDFMKVKSVTALPVTNIDGKLENIIFMNAENLENIAKKSQSLKDTSVIIMAGGKGTRLYPYTKILPKPLIPIGDIPILERIINRFCEYGISKYYLTVNYKKGIIKAHFSDLNPDYDVHYVEEDKPLGTAGSIKLITDKFTKPVIITNCDTLIAAEYDKLMEYHVTSGNALTIVSSLKNITVPYGVLHSKEHGEVVSMEEKPKLSYFINAGLYVMNPEFIEKIPDDTMFHMTHMADMLMKEGYKVGMYPISEDSFLDMGEFEEMKRMEEKLNII